MWLLLYLLKVHGRSTNASFEHIVNALFSGSSRCEGGWFWFEYIIIWFHDVSCRLTWFDDVWCGLSMFVDVCRCLLALLMFLWRVIHVVSQVVRLRFFEGGSSWARLSSLHQLRHGPAGLSRIKRGRERFRYILWGQLWGVDFAMQVVENDEKEEGFKSWRSKC